MVSYARFLAVFALTIASALPLSGQESTDDLIDLVVGLLNEKDKDVRALGFEQVRSEAKGTAATKRFAAELPKLAPDAQVGLLRALADRGDAAARPEVLSLLTAAQTPEVRIAAIESLGPLGVAGDLKVLVPLLSSSKADERTAAKKSLARLRDAAVTGTLIAELKAAKPDVQIPLIEVLALRRDADSVPTLLEAAVADESSVRTAAMAALGQFAAQQHVAGMVRGVLKAGPGAERDAAEKAVMLACQRIGDSSNRAAPVLVALDEFTAADRLSLLPLVGRLGGDGALSIVSAAVDSGDARQHEQGLRALCNWPDASVAARLMELSQRDEHPEHQALARAALIRVAPLPDGRSDKDRLDLLAKVMPLCANDAERQRVLERARAIRAIETLRFVLPYVDQPAYAQRACESVVELAHHRALREPHKAEFDKALDKVIATSKDAVVVERAQRYKRGQTWVRPMPRRSN